MLNYIYCFSAFTSGFVIPLTVLSSERCEWREGLDGQRYIEVANFGLYN
jgi:hypothetical protein